MMKKKQNLKRGFSLVEVVVAIGLVALLLVGVMGLMAPASRDIDRALSKEEAKNMAEALIAEMNTFRETDLFVGNVENSFAKAKSWMDNSNLANSAILIYKYSGKLGTVNKDGSLEAVKRGANEIQGKDYVVNTVARRLVSKKNTFVEGIAGTREGELASGVVTGKVYVAKFRNYTRGSGGLTLGGHGAITEWDGTLVAQMEIYALKSNSFSYINGLADLNKLGKPLYIKNVVFRR